MIAVVTLLLAIVLGFRIRKMFAASMIYAVAYLWSFTYQTLYLLLGSMGEIDDPPFTAGEFPLSYGLVTLAIFLVGFGLVALGHRLADRRSWRNTPAEAH